jgi:hypothetical protein
MPKKRQSMAKNYPKVNDWSNKKVKLLKYWQEECRLYKWLYTQNVEYYQVINRNLSIASILLSVITGATLLNNSNNTQGVNPNLVLAFGLISITSSFLQGVRQFLDLESKISSNLLASRQNSAIVIEIEEQLSLAREERINGNEFIKNIKSRKNEIIQNAPIISKYRWTQLKKKIARGEGINFFNETIFKNYLENTVDMDDLKLDATDDYPSNDVTPDVNYMPREIPTDDDAMNNNTMNINTTNNDYNANSHSEDELIEELQVENLGCQQLRTALYAKPSLQNTNNQNLNNILVASPENPSQQQHKLDALLKYHMSRL